MSLDETVVPVTPPVGKGSRKDELPNGSGDGVEPLPPVPVPRGPTLVPIVLRVKSGAVGRIAVPVRDVPVRFNVDGYDTGKLEPLEGPMTTPVLALDVGSGTNPEEEPIMKPVFVEFTKTVRVEADATPDPEGPLGSAVVFDLAGRLPVPIGPVGKTVGKMSLPVRTAVGPPVVPVRG